MKKIVIVLINILIISILLFTILPINSYAKEMEMTKLYKTGYEQQEFQDDQSTKLFSISTINPDDYKPQGNVDEKFVTEYSKKISGFFFVISIIVALICIMILGLQTIIGSASEKAEYKQRLIPIVTGILVISFITTIISALIKFAESI